jgi:PKD repeat protein
MVNGNITYRRQGNTSQYVYNFWGAPISNATLSSLAAPGYIPNLYAYNTATATGLDYLGTQAGWQPLTPGTAMQPTKGYIATGAGLANFTGLPNQIDLNYTAQTGAGGNNFNLVSNPYPAPIAASNFLTANAARISGGAMYLWDDDASGGLNYSDGDFIVYSGLGTVNGPNSGAPFSGNIGSCQGFFVNYNSAGGAAFNFTNGMKVYGTNSEFFDATTVTRMRLRMENVNTVASEAIVAFLADATDAADTQYDALRLAGNTQMSLYTFNGNLEYAVQAWPTLTNERIVELGTVNTVAGPSTISMNMFENFDPSVVVYLEDVELGVFHNLTADNIYTFNNTGLNGETVRFRLHFRAPIAVASSMDCSGTESGKIIIANPNASAVALEVKNANNEVVATAAPFVGEHEITNLSAGNYALKLTYSEGGSTTKNAVVESNGMTAPASFIASATTVSIADAIIEFQGTAQGASEYIWDFGDGTIVTGDLNPVHAYTSLGVYTVTFTALNNGCGSTATSTVSVTNDATGIGSATTNNGFSIFPNPATDVANLLLNVDRSETDVTISINDAAGRLVSTKLVNDVRSGSVIGLDINGLANGVYQVSVEGKNFRNVGRLTIAK